MKKRNENENLKIIDSPVMIISGGFFFIFIVAFFINGNAVIDFVNSSSVFASKYFGSFWQLLLLATFIMAIVIALSKYGNIKLGNISKPEMGYFKWISIIMSTLMAAGGIFWAAAEPLQHFISVPPYFGDIENGSAEAIAPALSQSFLHWGFLAWAINGTLSAIVIMYAHYHRGAPLKPRSLLYPIFGEKISDKGSILGGFTDAFSIVAVSAGTIGPIGFLGLQLGYSLEDIFGIPNNFTTQSIIIISIIAIVTISAYTGIHKGIQFLSTLNVYVVFLLLAALVLLGPGIFIFDQFLAGFGVYIQNFFGISTYAGSSEWLGSWTIFFFGWFIGYGPMMAVFVAVISKGRTIRQLILTIAVVAPIIMNFWFSIIGGTGVFLELNDPGSISTSLLADGQPAAMIAIINELPMGVLLAILFILSTTLFVITTGDSMTLSISSAVTGIDNPPAFIRIFWAIIIGVVSIILIYFGEGGIGALQNFIVFTAIPVSILLFFNFYTAPVVCKKLWQEQNSFKNFEEKQQDEDIIS